MSPSTSLRRRKWQPTQVLLPGKPHRQRSLVGCSPWGLEESHTAERLHFHFSLSCIGEGNGNPLQRSCLENPRDGGAWWAAVYGVTQSRTRLKRLSNSSSSLSMPTGSPTACEICNSGQTRRCKPVCAQPRLHEDCGFPCAEACSPREMYLAIPDRRPKDGKLQQLKPDTQRETVTSYLTFAWCRKAWHFTAHLPPACSRLFRNSGA